MAFTDFDREVLRKAMSILDREHEYEVVDRIRRVLWAPKAKVEGTHGKA